MRRPKWWGPMSDADGDDISQIRDTIDELIEEVQELKDRVAELAREKDTIGVRKGP